MSVINDVLRDLDARRSGGGMDPAAGLPAVKGGSRRRLLLVLLALASLVLLAVTLASTDSLPAPLRGWFGKAGPVQPGANAVAGKPGMVVVGGKPAGEEGPALTMDTGVGKLVGSALQSAGGVAVDAMTTDPRVRQHAKGVLGQVAAKMGDEPAAASEAGKAKSGKPVPVLLALPGAGEGDAAARAATREALSPSAAAAAMAPLATDAKPAAAKAARKHPRNAGASDESMDELAGGTRTVRNSAGPASDYDAALALIQDGKAEAGVEKLQRVLAQQPHHVRARETLIATLIDLRRIDEAARLASEGLAFNPNQPNLAMTLARLQLERGDLDQAISTLEGKLGYAGVRPDYHAFLAALQQRAARHRDAVEHYTVALRSAPNTGVWWVGLGISWQALGQNAEAEEAFRRARAAGNLSPELQAFVGNRLAQFKRH